VSSPPPRFRKQHPHPAPPPGHHWVSFGSAGRAPNAETSSPSRARDGTDTASEARACVCGVLSVGRVM
jgi:hypothetical protein